MRTPFLITIATGLVVMMLTGCAGKQLVPPVSEKGKPLRQPEAATREVVAGDTLYSIAWESGRDHRELAAWNGIAPPYVIKPGQKLRLYPPEPGGPARPAAATGPKTHVVKKGETLYRIALTHDLVLTELAAWNKVAPPYTLSVGQTLRLTPPGGAEGAASAKPKTEKVATAKPKTPEAPSRETVPKTVSGAWSWPADGKLLARFGVNGSKGIDISGQKGQSVQATQEGQVVYQGGGLKGYGQLIIIKHSTDFLSAYAHCDRIHVQEGDVVKRGQKIASMGASGTDRVKLHFEIRLRGNPVDPLTYLPRK